MTREEAIKIIDCYDIGFYDLSGEKIPADKLADALDMAIESLSAEQKWTPVGYRLPKENARYLVQMSYGIMQVLSWANNLEEIDDFDFYNKKHGGWYELDSEWGYCERHEVVAWMPLPKPYGESEVEE